jgi:putative transposase
VKENPKLAAAKVLKSTWQHCRRPVLCDALAHAGKGQGQVVLALLNIVIAQGTQDAAILQWCRVADQLRAKFPKLAARMDNAEQTSSPS